jgi:ATP-dependent RNA helicase DDX18/HAS1
LDCRDEVLVDCSGAHSQERSGDQVFDNKRSALLQLLSDVAAERTVVFCNTIDQCRRVENALLRQDRDHRMRKVLPYHGAIDAANRDSNLVEFCRPLLEQPAVLISTDRASRGMDFNKAHVS